jgi:hypothetical protein
MKYGTEIVVIGLAAFLAMLGAAFAADDLSRPMRTPDSLLEMGKVGVRNVDEGAICRVVAVTCSLVCPRLS